MSISLTSSGPSIELTGSGSSITLTVTTGGGGSGGGVTDHGALTGLSDDDHSLYALADGTRGSFASIAQGGLADSATQPGDPLRVVDVVSDGSTVTTVTATDGVLEADVLAVADGSGGNNRGLIRLPHPSEWPDQSVTLVGDDQGPSVGYLDPTALGWDAIDSAADVDGTSGSSDTNPTGGATLDYTGYSGPAEVVQWDAADDLGSDDLGGVLVRNVVVTGSPADVVIGVAITDDSGNPLDGGAAGAQWGSVFDNGDDVAITLSTPVAADDAGGVWLTVFVVDAGGSPVAPDTITFDSAHWRPATGAYVGYDNANLGVGELNPDDPTGPYTHAWNDSDYPGKSLRLFSDGAKLLTERVVPRWEFVVGATEPIGGPLDGLGNLGQVVDAANAAFVEKLDAADAPTTTYNEVADAGSAEELAWAEAPDEVVHDITMTEDCALTFGSASGDNEVNSMTVILRGAFTPTLPASIDWAGGSAPTYSSPSVYEFVTVDNGTTVLGFLAGAALS